MKIDKALTDFIRPSDHSKFSPSSMDRIIACPYSVEPSEQIPNETSVYAAEGTLCHSIAEALFMKESFGIEFSPKLNMDMLDWESKHTGSIDEMMDCSGSYVNTVIAWLKSEELVGQVLWYGLEKGIPIFPEELCFGSSDAVIVGTKSAVIIDYKHGKGKDVKADSIQLRTYLAGVCRHLTDIPEDYQFHAVIVQPRTSTVPKVHTYTKQELIAHAQIIKETIEISKQKDLYPERGSHCYWCKLSRTKDPNLKCPAIKNETLKVAQEEFGNFLADMNAPIADMKEANVRRDEAIIKIMSLLPLMEKIVKDSEEEFAHRIANGETIKGIQLVDKLGNRAWIHKDPQDMVEALKHAFPSIDPYRTRIDIKTITEVEKIVGKGKADTLTYRPLNKKIVVQDAKMQEVLGEMSRVAKLINDEREQTAGN